MKPGIYPGLSLQAYLDIPAVSSTGLRNMGKGPREYWHRQRFAREQTQAMLDGTLAGIQILDPQAYLDRVVEWKEPVLEDRDSLKWIKVTPDRYVAKCGRYELVKVGGVWQPITRDGDCPGEYSTVPAAKAACKEHYERTTSRKPKLDDDGNPKLAPRNENNARYKEFLVTNPGRTVVVRADLEKAARVARAVRDNPEARQLLSERWRTELTIVWEHESGALCKARPDWLTDPARSVVLIGDLKCVRNIDKRAFTRAAADREYHAQLAWYGEGLRAHYPDARQEHVLLAVESSGSHDSTVYDVPEIAIIVGQQLNEQRLQDILECRDRYRDQPWPGRCHRTKLDYETHAPWAIPEELREDAAGGYLDLTGVERNDG